MRVFGVEEYNKKIWDKIQEVASKPELIKKALEQSKTPHLKNLKLYKEELISLDHKLAEFNQYKENAIALRVKGKITEAEFNIQIERLEDEYKGLMARQRELSIKINYLKRVATDGIDKEAITRYVSFLRQAGNKLDIAQKRRILEAFISRIPIYGNGEFEVVFKFPIPTEETQPQYLQQTTSVSTDGAVKGRYLRRRDAFVLRAPAFAGGDAFVAAEKRQGKIR
jgi:hypothetical protein